MGVTSWPRLGRPCGPVQGVFNLSPLTDLRVFIFFLPPGEVRIPAEQMQARWQEAGFSRFPFMALHHPAAGWDLPAAPGCSAPGKTLQRLTPGCPVHELGCQMDIPAKMKHGEPRFVATLDARALSCVPRGCALAVPWSRALGCGGACLKSCFPFSAGAAKALSISSPTQVKMTFWSLLPPLPAVIFSWMLWFVAQPCRGLGVHSPMRPTPGAPWKNAFQSSSTVQENTQELKFTSLSPSSCMGWCWQGLDNDPVNSPGSPRCATRRGGRNLGKKPLRSRGVAFLRSHISLAFPLEPVFQESPLKAGSRAPALRRGRLGMTDGARCRWEGGENGDVPTPLSFLPLCFLLSPGSRADAAAFAAFQAGI